MALRGNLADFTLTDVFQLIALSRKTGVLRIRRRDASHGSVWFRDGDVLFAESNWRRERLGDRLVTAGRITPEALHQAVQVRAAEPQGRRLGTILVDEDHVSREVLEEFVREQILDTVFDLMRWDDGEFEFQITSERPEEDIGLAVSIENIAMESGRRLEEWEQIKRKVPSMDLVFKMSTAPGEGPFEISLKPVEWNLLLIIDGMRSVADLAKAARMTDFDVARVVYGLFSAGLLEVVSEDEAERLRAERAAGDAVAYEYAAQPIEPQGGTDAADAAEVQWREFGPMPQALPPGGVPTGPGMTELEVRYERIRVDSEGAGQVGYFGAELAGEEPAFVDTDMPSTFVEPSTQPVPALDDDRTRYDGAEGGAESLVEEVAPRTSVAAYEESHEDVVEPGPAEAPRGAAETDEPQAEHHDAAVAEVPFAEVEFGINVGSGQDPLHSVAPWSEMESLSDEHVETLRTTLMDIPMDAAETRSISDEITALTGVGHARHVAEGLPGAVSHDDSDRKRGSIVNRETLLGIIEGIKRL